MKITAFRYEFTPGELWFFLFGKKICPVCGGKLVKSKEWELKYGRDFDERDPHGYFPGDNEAVRFYRYYYTCRDCGEKFSLSELTDR